MTTRSRTLLFLQYRSSYTRSHLSRVPAGAGDTAERAGLIQNAADIQGGPGDGAAIIEMSVLPPQWVDTMEDIDEDMNRLQQSIKRLDELHQKQLLPGLDEGLRFERDIERLQAEITSQFRQCQHKIKQIGSKGGVSNTTNEEDRLGKNVQVALATRLQELSSMFRRKQSSFLQKLKQREARTKGLLFESSFSPSSFDDDDDSMTNNRGAFTKDQLALVEDTEALVTQRDREIQEITRSISELADIFQELQTMVIDQGTLLDRIDYNIEQVNASTRSAVEELTKAENYQKRTGKIKLILLLLLIIFGLILVLIFKPRSSTASASAPSTSESAPAHPVIPPDLETGML